MADVASTSANIDCPPTCMICQEEFDYTNRIPLHMPCCVHPICRLCVEKGIKGRKTLSCPQCRHQHHLPAGVNALPKDTVILKIMEHRGIQQGLRLPCRDCPYNHHAVARCDVCCIFLCQECINVHRSTRPQRDHNIYTFQEMRGRSFESFRHSHDCAQHKYPLQFYCHTCSKVICMACPVVDHKEGSGHRVVTIDEAHREILAATVGVMAKMEMKIRNLTNTSVEQERKVENINTSKQVAKAEITKTFDSLVEQLQLRKAILLSEVESRYKHDVKPINEAVESTRNILQKTRSSVQYIREMRSKADKIEDLQLMIYKQDPLNSLLQETPQDVAFYRTGISFVPASIQQLSFTIKTSGLVRTVLYKPKQETSDEQFQRFYNTVTLDPVDFPEAAGFDKVLTATGLYCPHLEWDTSTANQYLKAMESVISNTQPISPPINTGCRLKGERYALTSRPIVIGMHQRILYETKTAFSIKSLTPGGMTLFESALVDCVVDAQCNQHTGLSVRGFTCSNHNQNICLKVCFNSVVLSHIPMIENSIGRPIQIHLCYLIDGTTRKIHIINASVPKLIHTITNDLFNRCLWVKMYLDTPRDTSMMAELISGKRVTLSPKMSRLLSRLCK